MNILVCFIECLAEIDGKIVPMFEEFDGEVGATEFARVAKSFEVLFGFCGELRFIIAQEDEA